MENREGRQRLFSPRAHGRYWKKTFFQRTGKVTGQDCKLQLSIEFLQSFVWLQSVVSLTAEPVKREANILLKCVVTKFNLNNQETLGRAFFCYRTFEMWGLVKEVSSFGNMGDEMFPCREWQASFSVSLLLDHHKVNQPLLLCTSTTDMKLCD